MGNGMFLEERRRAILDRLERQGRVTVKTLSDLMHVSEVTIRQDLRALESRGVIKRTYGGAVYRGGAGNLPELSFNTRLTTMRQQKDAIAAHAASLLADGGSIALDSSTTTYALVPYLAEFNKLTIVTNGLIVAQRFLDADARRVRVLLPGGRLRRDSISVVGPPENLPAVNLTTGFFSCRGITSDIGPTEVDPDEVQMKQALLGRCRNIVLLVDGSKWGNVAPYTIVPAVELTHIITTVTAPGDTVEAFRARGVRVDIVDADHKHP